MDVTETPDRVPSPVATGGGGERFEQRVEAFALALLLTRSTAPVLIDALVTAVHLQTRHLGWRTDDLLIVAEVQPGVTRKLAVQAKRSFTISESDEECVRTICAMWDDFVAAERFNPALDRLAVATLHGTATLLKDFTSLLDCARAAASEEDFHRRLGLSGYLSKKAKRQNEALVRILRVHLGGEIDRHRYWQFLRIVTVLSFDLGTPTSQSDAMVLALLAHVAAAGADPKATAIVTWSRLLDIASEGRQSAASYVRNDLPTELRNSHNAIPTTDEQGRLDLVAHGRTVRRSIRASIARSYSLDRPSLADAVLNGLEEYRLVVLSGAAGSGKSAIAKMLLDRIEAERPVLAFQAVEFATAHINDTLSRTQTALNAGALLAILAAHDRSTILIDGVERLLEHSVRDAFTQLLQIVAETLPLRLVLTCREYSLDTVRSALLEPLGLMHKVVEVGPLSDGELEAVAEQVSVLAPPLSDHRMRAFLRTPYLLDMAARLEWTTASLPESVRVFRQRCWHNVVRNDAHRNDGMPGRREGAFVRVARQRAEELTPYVRPAVEDQQALDALVEASLLERSPGSNKLYAPAHDVLEDWAILEWLDDVASTAGDPPAALAAAVGGLPAIRRGFRRWVGERLKIDPIRTRELVLEVSGRTDVPQYFRDDCTVAALLSAAASEFLEGCHQRIAAGDRALIWHLVHLLRVGCKTVPPWLTRSGIPSAMLIPTGSAWPTMLDLVAQQMPTEADGDALLVLGLVEDWARQVTIGSAAPAGADAAGRIVSALVPLFGGSWRSDTYKRALKVLLTIPTHAAAFDDLAQRAIARDRDDREVREFADLALSTLSSAFVSRDYPDFMIALLRSRLMLSERDRERHGYRQSSFEVDECFGMPTRGHNEFFPASALQGPFRALFQHHPRLALDFVLELANHAASWYGGRKWPGHDLEEAERVTIDVPDHGPVEQWFVGRLYALYRGMTVGPYSLQSALMALEEFLLTIAKDEGVDLDAWLLGILAEGNSALTTGVVASVCVAYPTRAARTAVALLSTRELVEYDRSRMAAEGPSSIEFLVGLDWRHQIYEAERREANKLPHRQEDLEALALKLQFTDLRDEVWALIDKHRARLAGPGAEGASLWRLALHRMDIRGFRVFEMEPGADGRDANPLHGAMPAAVASTEATSRAEAEPPPEASESHNVPEASQGTERVKEQRVYAVPGRLEPDLQSLVAETQQHLAVVNRHLALRLAAQKAWEKRRGPEAAKWRSLLAEAQAIAEQDDEIDMFARGGPGIVAAMCIRDQLDALSTDARAWCIARVTYELSMNSDDRDGLSSQSRMFGPDRAAAAVVALLVAKVPEQLPADGIDLLVQALTHPTEEVVEYAYAGAGMCLGAEHGELAFRCAAAAAREAAVLGELATARRERSLFETSPDVDEAPAVTAVVREALRGTIEEAKAALAGLEVDSWSGRAAAVRVWPLMLGRAESTDARSLVARAATWLADTWGEERRNRADRDRDFNAEQSLSRLIGRFALKLRDDEAVDICAPLIALAATEPREVATFVWNLVLEADGGAGDSFWALWQAVADRAVSAVWVGRLNSERPYEAPLISRLFLRISWKEGTTHWARLEGNAYRIHALASRLPPVSVVAEAYLHFLYDIGRQELPDAFKVLESMLERSESVQSSLTSEATFVLESLLGLFVYGQPLRLKRDAALRQAVLRLLDQLVSSGSSAAYRMRDDFVTPLRAGDA